MQAKHDQPKAQAGPLPMQVDGNIMQPCMYCIEPSGVDSGNSQLACSPTGRSQGGVTGGRSSASPPACNDRAAQGSVQSACEQNPSSTERPQCSLQPAACNGGGASGGGDKALLQTSLGAHLHANALPHPLGRRLQQRQEGREWRGGHRNAFSRSAVAGAAIHLCCAGA